MSEPIGFYAQQDKIAALTERLRIVEAEAEALKRDLETERIGLQHIEMGLVDGKPTAEFTMDGSAAKRIIEALCVHFVEMGGENFVETSFEIRPALKSPPGVQKMGEFYFTIQRKKGTTPGGQLSEARKRIAELEAELSQAKQVSEDRRQACMDLQDSLRNGRR